MNARSSKKTIAKTTKQPIKQPAQAARHFDARVDSYIAKAAPFAQPILKHLREIVHAVCPDVEETLRWSMPSFSHHGVLCSMAAFKAHCAFGFWKGSLIVDSTSSKSDDAMGQFGRITSLQDLPAKKLIASYVKIAMRLNEEGVRAVRPKRKARPALAAPAYLTAALKKNNAAQKTFTGFSPSQQREYIEWLLEAKTDATRERRLATTVEWLAEGKVRNWKYQ